MCAAHSVRYVCAAVCTPKKFYLNFEWLLTSLLRTYLRLYDGGALFVSTRLAIAGPSSLHLSPFFGKRLINCALLVKRSAYLHSGSKFRSGGPAIARDKKYIAEFWIFFGIWILLLSARSALTRSGAVGALCAFELPKPCKLRGRI